ncbi:MAG: hypothetical protein IJH41_04705, partial [Eubacterium sp.]|nr:hypothetical protein [Eubacterium sp.]
MIIQGEKSQWIRIRKNQREKALAHENGKEPFDFLKFISIYVHDTGTFESLKPDEPESVREQYELFYYHFYPQFILNQARRPVTSVVGGAPDSFLVFCIFPVSET